MPPDQVVTLITDRLKVLSSLKARWNALKAVDLVALNAKLRQAELPLIEIK